jgi:hypothetical protein
MIYKYVTAGDIIKYIITYILLICERPQAMTKLILSYIIALTL